MNVIDKLKWLTDKEEGMGIPLIVVARYSHCHPTTLSNYLHGKSQPTERLQQMVNDGIKNIINILKEKSEDNE